jgi:hypothetical protein
MEAPSEANKLEPKVVLRVLGLTSRPHRIEDFPRGKGSILSRIGGNLEKEKRQGGGMVVIDS